MEHTIRERCYECGSVNITATPQDDYPDTMASRMKFEPWEMLCMNCERVIQRARVMRAAADALRRMAITVGLHADLNIDMADDAKRSS